MISSTNLCLAKYFIQWTMNMYRIFSMKNYIFVFESIMKIHWKNLYFIRMCKIVYTILPRYKVLTIKRTFSNTFFREICRCFHLIRCNCKLCLCIFLFLSVPNCFFSSVILVCMCGERFQFVQNWFEYTLMKKMQIYAK